MTAAEPNLLHLRWNAALETDHRGAPLVPALFAAGQGPEVHLVDLRPPGEATGVLGAIPGSLFLRPDQLTRAARPVVLVSADGNEAADAAFRLAESGMKYVAAMAGGLAAWRALGLRTSRTPREADDSLSEATPPAPPETSRLSLAQVREHIGDPRAVRWVKLVSLVAHGTCSCVDGRDGRSVIGTPGGDAGEFVLALAALEHATGARLAEPDIEGALLAHLDTFGAFYMHSDAHAFNALIDRLREDERTQKTVENLQAPEDRDAFFHHPADKTRDALLEHATNPDHVGCGHLRLMLQHSDEYGLRRELVAGFVRSFLRLLWKGAPELHFTLLPGGHAEGAVVNIRLESDLWALSPVPLISPACAGVQMFVNHPDVAQQLRGAIREFHVGGLGPVPVTPSRAAAFGAAYEDLASRHLTSTLAHLAKGLPVYDVVFPREGAFRVEEGGA
jgi:rhodanese-related sulfurtransferase